MTSHPEGVPEGQPTPPAPGSIADTFREVLPDVEFVASQGPLDVVIVIDRKDVGRVLRAAKDDPRLDLKYLRCLCGIDHMDEGLEVVYQLYSFNRKHGVTIKTRLPQDDARVESVTSVWRGADWHERETAEMFGIVFEGHPNPLPLLLPEDMTDHHPLRKDNPLQKIEDWQGVLVGPKVSELGHFAPGYEHLSSKGEAAEGQDSEKGS